MGLAARRLCTNYHSYLFLGCFADLDRGEFIFDKFEPELRSHSLKDWLILRTDVPEYVMSVLTPELALMLIKDDLKINDEQARITLTKSANVGTILNGVK